MFPRIDTKSVPAVLASVQQTLAGRYPGTSPELLDRLFSDVAALFNGQHADYQAIDLRYHDLEHTLQATLCLSQLLAGCFNSAEAPEISARQYQLGIAAVLLHDTGYLKLRSDTMGTGAKYTFCHVLRSCAFAASYLPTLGFKEEEISGVLSAINCTGPTKEIGRLQFRDRTERFIGSALATADYLGQMAAADYPEELEILFAEFAESDDFVNLPAEQRLFRSAQDLINRTPSFWRNVVQPKLETEFQRAYQFLAAPFSNGANASIDAVNRNITLIEQRAVSCGVSVN